MLRAALKWLCKIPAGRGECMNNKELAHLWANDAAPRKGSNFFFDAERVIYSYGAHFPIARFVDAVTVFFTDKGYSNTTAKHKGYARNAIKDGVTVYTVPDVRADSAAAHSANAEAMRAELESLITQAIKSRTRFESLKEAAEDQAALFVSYVRRFVPKSAAPLHHSAQIYKMRLSRGGLFSRAEIEKKREQIRREREQAAARAEIEKAERAARLDKWKQGVDIRDNFYSLPPALRLKDSMIETSHGARVNLISALILFKAWQAARVSAAYSELAGREIDHYTVTAADSDRVKIGCHVIEYAEAARVLSGIAADVEIEERG